MRGTVLALSVLGVVSGCYDFPIVGQGDGPADDLAGGDRAIPDLHTSDGTMPDLAMRDLAMPDLAMPDLASLPDLLGIPTLSQVTPPTGPTNGGVKLTIDGSNFVAGQGLTVLVDGKIAGNVQWISATQLTAVLPADFGQAGAVAVTVTNPDGTSGTRGDLFAYYLGALNFDAQNYTVGQLPRGVAAADFDGDGTIDLATSDWAGNTISVLLGNGDATFQKATQIIAGGDSLAFVAAGQLNNGDKAPDLVAVSAGSNEVLVFINDTKGSFKPAVSYAVANYPVAVAVADLDGKGGLDLVTLNQMGNNVSVLLGVGDGSFGMAKGYPVDTRPTGLVLADFNGDGRLDVATSDIMNENVSILFGQGDGTFGGPQNSSIGSFPGGLTTGDFDGDGKIDAAVATRNGGIGLAVLLSNGNGTLQPFLDYLSGGPNGSFVVAVGDFNLDGKLDVTADAATDITVLLGDGKGVFAGPAHYGSVMTGSFMALVVADFDGDGRPDIAGPADQDDTLVVLHNTSQ